MPKTLNVDPFTFLAQIQAGRYSSTLSFGGAAIKVGDEKRIKESFDPFSAYILRRITCVCGCPVSIQILEGNELIHLITEGKEYSTDVKDILIRKFDHITAKIITVEKENEPLLIRFEGNLIPAGTLQ